MNGISIDFHKTGGKWLYEQIYKQLKDRITKGELPYETKLPSKRKLAEFLKVSQNTVEAAYGQLVAEGYVHSRPKSGFFVSVADDFIYAKEQPEQLERQEKIPEKYLFDFNPNNIDTAYFPFQALRRYARNVISPSNRELLSLGDRQGEYRLREEIKRYIYFARGAVCTSEQIIISSGTETMLRQLALLFDGDTLYGLEDPGYYRNYYCLKAEGKNVELLKTDQEGLIVEELEKSGVNIVYVTPSHQFPNGGVLSASRRAQLLNWAEKENGRYIIEDDYDSEFRYRGKPIPSLQSMNQDKVIYFGTFSKSLIPSLRISYMVLPENLLNRYKEKLFYLNCPVSRIRQHILAQFMQNGDYEKHINKMRKTYGRKLETLAKIFLPHKKNIETVGHNAGFYVMLIVKNGLGEAALVAKAGQAGIKVCGLSEYTLLELKDGYPKIILGVGGIDEAELPRALHLLLTAWGIEITQKEAVAK